MRLLILALFLTACSAAPRDCTAKAPCMLATNFSSDILGDLDDRQDTWGRAGYTLHRIKFTPPVGHRVRITKVQGDFVAWPKRIHPSDYKQGYAGALFGLVTTAPDGSVRADWAADNTMLYVQVATSGEAARAAFEHDVSAGGLLEADHVLIVKMAAWLNTLEVPIHCEPSFTLVYHWEKE
jgi:hypothetical protein